MNNSFYDPEDYYLEHHGILGMKWGKQNGPPYPLSDAKHDRIVERAEKKQAKRKSRIAKDPKKLYKYMDEFTEDELNEAIRRLDIRSKIEDRIPKKKRQNNEVKLSAAKKRWAKNPSTLLKNAGKYTKEEFALAYDILTRSSKIFDEKMNRANRPKRVMDIGAGYLTSFKNAATTVKDIKKLFDGDGKDIKLKDDQMIKASLAGFDVGDGTVKNMSDREKHDLYEFLFNSDKKSASNEEINKAVEQYLKSQGII